MRNLKRDEKHLAISLKLFRTWPPRIAAKGCPFLIGIIQDTAFDSDTVDKADAIDAGIFDPLLVTEWRSDP